MTPNQNPMQYSQWVSCSIINHIRCFHPMFFWRFRDIPSRKDLKSLFLVIKYDRLAVTSMYCISIISDSFRWGSTSSQPRII